MSGRLSARRARTFYNVADAWIPPGEAPGAGDVDLLPGLEERLRGWGALRVLGLLALLRWIEAEPRLALKGGFSGLARTERARRLRAWEASRFPPRRAASRGLRRLVEALYADQSACGP